MHIAFIGLGNMGLPMARNLLKAGFTLSVFDLVAEAMSTLAAEGAKACTSAGEAARQADVILTMLPASQHVEQIYLGDGGLLVNARAGAILVDCSTIAPAVARKVAQAAEEAGFPMLDAPVSGGTAGAAAGTLTFMVGGAAEVVEQVRPLLERMGKNIYHAGSHGAGQIVKMCNNMMLGILMAGTAEALNLGVAHGLDPKVLSEIMSKSSGRNWALEVYNPWPGVMENAPASKGYAGGFGVDLMLKDLGLALEAAIASKVATPMGAQARGLYALHSAQGNGKLDFSSILQLLHAS
ncbi:3-hydroxyisobutyrate dehydrogenase [Leeia aquatica]|uniref:3-hydroxyisobutyrate dehydrogenase n=1 Tax=Leeia aquatica TaxID=2725557 RepID=A0A847S1Z3_9NEIS|nr:3-hydroxyisobutyrate dehydrogenase [Leeia aquatica]NLR73744.1 3-hydroxyisobutyrate dehydrogenase [Leeia aquatica]